MPANREMWYADATELTNYAYNISGFEYATPALRGTTARMPFRSGSIPRFNRAYEPGEFALNMWIIGGNTDGSLPTTYAGQRAAFDANFAAVLAACTKQNNVIMLKRTYNGVSVRAEALPTADSMSVAMQAARTRSEVTFTFELVDAFWEDATATTQSATAGATLPKTLDLTGYAGATAPLEDAVVTVTGPITNPRVTDAETGVWVQYTGTVAAGASWVVDSGAFTSKVGSTSVRAATSHGGHARFLYVPPLRTGATSPRLTLTGSAGGTGTQMSVVYRRKYLVP